MTALAVPLPPAIRGFVEAMGPERVVGWAWHPAQPGARVQVELRDGDTVLAAMPADQPRADLARNGVGDGAHAFAFTLDDPAHDAARLSVVAIDADGTAVPLGAPPPAPDDGRRALDSLVSSQRVLHRNLQAVLLAVKAREPVEAALDRIGETQAGLAARISELEGFVLRLDTQLAHLAPQQQQPSRAGRGSLLVLCAAIAVAAGGFAAMAVRLVG
jgi:hypothetical protein